MIYFIVDRECRTRVTINCPRATIYSCEECPPTCSSLPSQPLLRGPADEFPANFLFFFREPKSGYAKNLKKNTDRGRTEAPFPLLLIFTPRALPPPPTNQFVIGLQWNCPFWQRHGITHVVDNAVTSPESAIK